MGKLVRKLFLLKPDDGVHSHATERRMRGELVGVGDGLNMRIKKEQRGSRQNAEQNAINEL